jgi:hypothetical protein
MRLKRGIKIAVVLALSAVVVGGSALWLMLAGVPREYEPLVLTQQERDWYAQQFVNTLVEFSQERPYDLTITQDEMNAYLASMGEIAWRLGLEPAVVEAAMQKAHLQDPAVVMKKGMLTTMVRWRKLDKILSADLEFYPSGDNKLLIHLKEARVGMAPIPQAQIFELLEGLKPAAANSRNTTQRAGEVPAQGGYAAGLSRDISEVVLALIDAISGQPIDAVVNYHGRLVRFEKIEVSDGLMTIKVRPLGRNSAKDGHKKVKAASQPDL